MPPYSLERSWCTIMPIDCKQASVLTKWHLSHRLPNVDFLYHYGIACVISLKQSKRKKSLCGGWLFVTKVFKWILQSILIAARNANGSIKHNVKNVFEHYSQIILSEANEEQKKKNKNNNKCFKCVIVPYFCTWHR